MEYLLGGALGYIVAAYLIGLHINKKVEDALTVAMLQTCWKFVNERNGEAFDLTAEWDEDSEIIFEPDED